MEDENKTNKQLITELGELRQSVVTLKVIEEQFNQAKVDQEKFTKAFLQNSIPVSIATLKEGRIIDISDAFLDLIGRKRDEVIGHTSIELGLLTEEQRAYALNELNKSGRIKNFESAINLPGIGLRYGIFNTNIISLNNEDCLLMNFQDITERRCLEEALSASEIKYRKLHQSMRDAFVSVDMEGYIKDYNDGYLNMLGYAPEELSKFKYNDLTPEKWHKMEADIVENQILTQGYSDIYEKEYRRKDGTVFPVELRTVLLRNAAGNPDGMWAIVRDATERKKAELKIQESEEKYRHIFNGCGDAIFIHDKEERMLEVNQQACEQFGYTHAELMSMKINQLDSPEEVPKIPERINRVISKGSFIFEIAHRRKDGTNIQHEVNSQQIIWHGQQAIMSICRDISERNKKTEILAQSEYKYRTITENLIDYVCLVDMNSVYQYVINSKVILGYELEDMVGISSFSITHPEDLARITGIYKEGIENMWHEISYETRLRHKDGRYVPMEIRARTFYDSEGKTVGAVLVGNDITKYREIQNVRSNKINPLTYKLLSPREKEMLGWIMQGKSTWDISLIINISERTVKFHIDNAMKKLSALNRAHAVAIAMENELINK